MAGKLHLIWLCDAPSPYNADLFRELARADRWDLVVHYRAGSIGSHPWQSSLTTGYPSRVTRTRFGIDWTLVRAALRPSHDLAKSWFVVGGWNHPTAVLLLLILAMRRGNVMIWTDTPNLERERPFLTRVLRSSLLGWLFGRMRWVLGTGAPAVDALVKMGAPPERVASFPYWIDASLYSRSSADERDREEDAPVVFFSSGLLDMQRKGHDVALRAFAALHQRGHTRWQYLIAGVGPDADALRRLAETLGIAKQVSWLGWLEPDALRAHLRAADVFIHPSPVHEPYGVAVLEAMAAGLPVLASSRTCAALDRIRPGQEGFIHSAGASEELSRQIENLLEGEVRERMGQASLRSAREWPLERATGLLHSLMEAKAS